MKEHEFKNYDHTVTKGAMLDTLVALVENGPIWDGDIPSKLGRDELISLGLASRVLMKGQDGFTGATYRGRDLYCFHFGKSKIVDEAKAYPFSTPCVEEHEEQLMVARPYKTAIKLL